MGLGKATAIFSSLALLVILMSGCGGVVSAASPTNPQITSVSPSTARVASSVTLQVTGDNFSPDSQVIWNGVGKNTTFVNSNTLLARIPSTDLAQPTTATVFVNSPSARAQSNNAHVKVVQQLLIKSSVLSTATAGSGYSTNLTASGGSKPYTWGASSALPQGLSLSSNGSISGTPTTAGTYSFGVDVHDNANPNQVATGTISVTVTTPVSQLTASSATLPAATVGKSYSAALQASGGTTPYAWSASGLPAGLTLSSSGSLSGTPTTSGSYSFKASVTDSSSTKQTSTGTYSISITTAAAPLIVATTSLPTATSGASYSASLSASGGSAPYTWSATSGLPTGLVVNSNGTITGTPSAAGSFNVGVKVLDSASPSQSASATIPLTIDSASSPLLLTTGSLPAATVGKAYSATVSASGGSTPYSWSATGLPSGLSMSTSGVISGTPTTAGTSVVGVKVVDASSPIQSQSGNYQLVVGSATTAVQVTTSSLPGGTVSSSYQATLAASGGTSPYSWSVASGQLPAGVALSSSGTISGTPTASGTYTFTVQAKDSSSTVQSATKSLSIAVAAQAAAAPTGTTPTISNLSVSVTQTTATITWTTDVASDTMVYFGRGEDVGYTQGILDTSTGVTTHKQTLTGLWPGKQYQGGVRSRGFSSGAPSTALAAFNDSLNFTTAAPPTSGTFDYTWEFLGPHHVTQGYEIYIAMPTTITQGSPNRVNYTVSGLPPYSSVRWPDMAAGQCCGVLSKNSTGDTQQLYSPSDTQMEIITNVGGTTPAGNYKISVTTSTGTTVGGSPVYTKTWDIVVDPVQTLAQNAPSSAPAIPNKADWESNMLSFGTSWCNNVGTPGSMMSVQYYDGIKVYYNIADYTNNPGMWNACAANVRTAYRDGYVLPNNGAVSGYNRFTFGLYTDYLRTSDSLSKTAVDLMSPTGGLVNGWNITPSRIREIAYLLNAYRYDTKLGNDRTALTKQTVDILLGHIDQIVVSGNAAWNQPFMCGLAAEALIDYYEDGHQSDTRIPIAIKQMADYLWANAWGKDANGHGFYYNSFDYSIGHPHSDMSNLNLLIAPMYGWLYRYTGDATYQQEGDIIFSDGATYGASGLGYNGGKNFSQQYHWSFDYIKYRTIP